MGGRAGDEVDSGDDAHGHPHSQARHLLGAEGITLNIIPNHLSTIGDNLERHAIANTRVDRG
jgi:hypothetical protein